MDDDRPCFYGHNKHLRLSLTNMFYNLIFYVTNNRILISFLRSFEREKRLMNCPILNFTYFHGSVRKNYMFGTV